MKNFSKNKKYFFLVAIRLPQGKLEYRVQQAKGVIENEKYH